MVQFLCTGKCCEKLTLQLITVKNDLCTSHMGEVLHVHLTMATVEMETRLQSNMGGSCHRRIRVQAREKQLSRKLRLGSSNGGQSCTMEDFMNVLTVLVETLAVSDMSKNVLNRLTSVKYCSNTMYGQYGRLD